MLLVPIPVPDPGPPSQKLPGVEGAAEGDVEHDKEGNGQVEESLENPGPFRGPTLQSGDPRLSSRDAGGAKDPKAGGRGRRGRTERGVGVGTEGEGGTGRGEED